MMGFFLLMAAGNDSTKATYCSGMRALIENPDQRGKRARRPVAGPERGRGVAADVPGVRPLPPHRDPRHRAQRHARSARATRWSCGTSSSNRDESRYEDPDRFDVDAQPRAPGVRRRRPPLLPRHRAGPARAADPVRGDAEALSRRWSSPASREYVESAVRQPAQDAAGAARPARVAPHPAASATQDRRMPAPLLPTRATSPDRVLMAVHGAEWGGAQLVALGQARALRGDYDLVIAVGHGPLRAAFAEAAAAVVACIRQPCRSGARRRAVGRCRSPAPSPTRCARRARPAPPDRPDRRQQHRAAGARRRRPARGRPGDRARAGGADVRGRAATVPRARRAGAHRRRDLALDRATRSTVPARSVLAEPGRHPRPPRSRAAGALRRGSVRLVMVGTVDRHKRQDVAIAAIGRLRDQGLEAELTLYGPEPDRGVRRGVARAGARRSVADQVHFAGPTSDVHGALLNADALVLPAGEVTPLVLMEAMALRTPVVAARMGSIPDVVTDGVSGLLVAPDDPDALAAAVVRLRREEGLAQRLAEGGRRRVEEHFDELAAHRRLSAEIGRLTAGRAGRPAAGSRVAVRRLLGASLRRARATLLRWQLRASPTRVAGWCSSTTRRSARAADGAGRARDHRSGARAPRAASAPVVPAREGVRVPRRAMLGAPPLRADPGRDHLRRRPRQPPRGCGAACCGASDARRRSS